MSPGTEAGDLPRVKLILTSGEEDTVLNDLLSEMYVAYIHFTKQIMLFFVFFGGEGRGGGYFRMSEVGVWWVCLVMCEPCDHSGRV